MPDPIMNISRRRLFFLKNTMATCTFFTTIFAVALLHFATYYWYRSFMWEEAMERYFRIGILMDLLVICLCGVVIVIYERPIRRYLNLRYSGAEISPDMGQKARKRLLNEPFFIAGFYVFVWLIGALEYAMWMSSQGLDSLTIRMNLGDALAVMLISLTVVLTVLTTLLQRHHAPYFFPRGRLHDIQGVKRVSIRIRFIMLLAAINLLPLGSIMRTQVRVLFSNQPPEIQLAILIKAIWFITGISIVIGIVLTFVVSGNMLKSLNNIIFVLRKIAQGRFDYRVRVTTNDEFGYVGDVINEMTVGLKERERLQRSLELAREVQQHLIPVHNPDVEGLDISGRSIYCDETGGDYYDYLILGNGSQKVGVAVGDVSGHGVQSALLMATARAFLRQRAVMPGGIARIVADVNRQLVRDVEETGQFMTLFYCEIESDEKIIHWVNAGHYPAILYDRHSNSFDVLPGRGMALGLDEAFVYEAAQRTINPGQIIIITTDGVLETHNRDGEMFGLEKLKEVITSRANQPAKEILDAVLEEVLRFTYPLKRQDDITLVVIKMES